MKQTAPGINRGAGWRYAGPEGLGEASSRSRADYHTECPDTGRPDTDPARRHNHWLNLWKPVRDDALSPAYGSRWPAVDIRFPFVMLHPGGHFKIKTYRHLRVYVSPAHARTIEVVPLERSGQHLIHAKACGSEVHGVDKPAEVHGVNRRGVCRHRLDVIVMNPIPYPLAFRLAVSRPKDSSTKVGQMTTMVKKVNAIYRNTGINFKDVTDGDKFVAPVEGVDLSVAINVHDAEMRVKCFSKYIDKQAIVTVFIVEKLLPTPRHPQILGEWLMEAGQYVFLKERKTSLASTLAHELGHKLTNHAKSLYSGDIHSSDRRDLMYVAAESASLRITAAEALKMREQAWDDVS